MKKSEQRLRIICFVAGELFAAFSVIRFLMIGEPDRILLSAVTLLLLCVPHIAEKLLDCRLSLPVYLFALFYAIGAMLGHSYKFYYLIPWWDKMLHIFGGVAFALVGYFLARRMRVQSRSDRWFYAVFALCFSMAVALLWEFFDFGMDTFFNMDMQNDTVVHAITSYKLGDEFGVLGYITDIGDVVIDCVPLGLGGYLDIGPLDTMGDTLLESLGALMAVVYLFIDIGKHPAFIENKSCVSEGSEYEI